MEIPLFQPTIGTTGSISPLPVAPQAPVAGTGPETMMAQVQAGAEERRRRVNQQTFEMGMQLTAFFAETITEARFHQGKRDLMVGSVEIDPAEQREKIVNILEGANTMQYDQQGNVVYDHAQIANEITSISDLMLALELTNYEDWQTLFDLSMASLSEKVSEANGAITRRRLQRWLGEQLEDMKAEMSIKAARQHARETEAQFYNQFEIAVNDGDIDTALTIIDQMRGFRMLTGPQEALMRNNVEQVVPINILTDQMLSAVFRGDTQEEIEQQLEDIRKLTENEGSILEQDEETGKFEINRITPAQFADIQRRTRQELADRQRIEFQAIDAQIQEAASDLQRMYDEGTLTANAVNSKGLLDLNTTAATNLHANFMNRVRALNDQIQQARDAQAQSLMQQFELEREAARDMLVSQINQDVLNRVISPQELTGRITELAMAKDQNGLNLFDFNELNTLEERLLRIITSPNRNITAQITQEVENVLQSRVTGSGQQREAMLRQKNRDIEIFTRGINDLEAMFNDGQITTTEYEDRVKALRDRVLGIGEDLSTLEMVLDGQVMNVDLTLTYEGVARVGQDSNISRAENLIAQRNYIDSLQAAQAGAFAIPTQEAEVGALRIQQASETSFQGMFSHYLGDGRRTYTVHRDITNNTVIRESVSMMGVLESPIEREPGVFKSDVEQYDLDEYISYDPERGAMFSFQMRIDPENRNRPTMAIRNEKENKWEFVNRLSEGQRQILGFVPTFELPERQPATFAPTRPDSVPTGRTTIPTSRQPEPMPGVSPEVARRARFR